MKKIGIYSGTFDPVHKGHVSFAIEASEIFNLDRVYFLVEPRPRRKQGVKALEHRVNMVQIAVKDNPKLGTIIINQMQFTTRDTMPIIASRFKGAEIHMLIGDDTLDHIADWPQVEELLSSVSFIVGARLRTIDEVKAIVKKISKLKGQNIDSKIFEPRSNKVSSSIIKSDLRARGASKFLDSSVFAYIEENNLYKPNED